jgi:hypothetical protein
MKESTGVAGKAALKSIFFAIPYPGIVMIKKRGQI